MDMDISDKQLERWIIDINEWAEGRIYCFILFGLVLDGSLLTYLGCNSKEIHCNCSQRAHTLIADDVWTRLSPWGQ